MTNPIHPPQQTISFPRPTFAKLSPHPYLTAHLQPSDSSIPPCRANGRTPGQFRPVHANTSSLTHCVGSAVVRIGDTAVVCGVQAEILLARDVPFLRFLKGSEGPGGGGEGAGGGGGKRGGKRIDLKTLDLLVPNVELATGCSPLYLPGQPPSPLAQSLSTRIRESLFSTAVVDEEGLCIWYQSPKALKQDQADEDQIMDDDDGGDGDDKQEEKHENEKDENAVGMQDRSEIKAFWTLYIDILFISLDGNPYDAAWAAVLAALHDVRLPQAYWDADREMILCSDESATSSRLHLRGLPVAVSATVFKTKETGGKQPQQPQQQVPHWILVDPDTFEEGLCEEKVTLMLDCTNASRTQIRGISKSGGGALGKREMRDLLTLAEKRWLDFARVIKPS